jgi:hypothetical protein
MATAWKATSYIDKSAIIQQADQEVKAGEEVAVAPVD